MQQDGYLGGGLEYSRQVLQQQALLTLLLVAVYLLQFVEPHHHLVG